MVCEHQDGTASDWGARVIVQADGAATPRVQNGSVRFPNLKVTEPMEGQRQKSGGGRRRRRKKKGNDRPPAEPVMIAARRPNSPLLGRPKGRNAVAASAAPAQARSGSKEERKADEAPAEKSPPPRRAARIVSVARSDADAREQERLRLLDRLMDSETRGAITRSADAYVEAGFEFPVDQEVQLQLLEHFDEDRAREAVVTLERILEAEPPLKKPILDQRLKRLEEYADDPATREVAAKVRRQIR